MGTILRTPAIKHNVIHAMNIHVHVLQAQVTEVHYSNPLFFRFCVCCIASPAGVSVTVPCAYRLTLYFIPLVSLPCHSELVGCEGASVPRYVVTRTLQSHQ